MVPHKPSFKRQILFSFMILKSYSNQRAQRFVTNLVKDIYIDDRRDTNANDWLLVDF